VTSIDLILASVVSLLISAPQADEHAAIPHSPQSDDLELSDDQLQYFVENTEDFLYRLGGRLDQFDYELIEELPSRAAIWYDRAYARLKHEVAALCERTDQYDALGLAEELDRVGDEFTERYSDRVRQEVSQLPESVYGAVRNYVWASDVRVVSKPWEVILDMVRNAPQTREGIADFICKLAHERL